MTTPLPVTVIGGYLGSGKTTMVNHLLRNADGQRLAVLVNEFGELPIDEDLIEAQDDDIISIAGGCVCCSYGSDLTAALIDLAELDPAPDHLLIESSGVALPGAIVAAVSLLDVFRADGVVILADAETVQAHAASKYMSDTVLRQLADANIVVLNKTDLVSTAQLTDLHDWVKTQNPDARLIEAEQGCVPPSVVMGSFLVKPSGPEHSHNTQNLLTETLIPAGAVDVDALAQELAADAAGLIRAKGFATSRSGQKMLIQIVGNRWQTSEAPAHMDDGIVCLRYHAS